MINKLKAGDYATHIKHNTALKSQIDWVKNGKVKFLDDDTLYPEAEMKFFGESDLRFVDERGN